jgi:hypothetical protein
MGIKKFVSFTTENLETESEPKIKILSTALPNKPLLIKDVTDEMIDTSLTELEKEKKTSGRYDPAANSDYSKRYQKLEDIKNLVEENFINLLHNSLSRNDKKFLKKAVKFLQENS